MIGALREHRHDQFDKINISRTALWDKNGDPIYSLWHNYMFSKHGSSTVANGASASRLRYAAQFGQKLVFDFSWVMLLSSPEIQKTCRQAIKAYVMNRRANKEPFDLWFSSLKPNSDAAHSLIKELPSVFESGKHLIQITEAHFTDLFSPDGLIYLTVETGFPEITNFEWDKTYILGALHDSLKPGPERIERIKNQGVKVLRLPFLLEMSESTRGPDLLNLYRVLLFVQKGTKWTDAIEAVFPSAGFLKKKSPPKQNKLASNS